MVIDNSSVLYFLFLSLSIKSLLVRPAVGTAKVGVAIMGVAVGD